MDTPMCGMVMTLNWYRCETHAHNLITIKQYCWYIQCRGTSTTFTLLTEAFIQCEVQCDCSTLLITGRKKCLSQPTSCAHWLGESQFCRSRPLVHLYTEKYLVKIHINSVLPLTIYPSDTHPLTLFCAICCLSNISLFFYIQNRSIHPTFSPKNDVSRHHNWKWTLNFWSYVYSVS